MSTSFPLVGGLGNQLFVYFAGKFFESETGNSVVFLASNQAAKAFSHLSSIQDFTLSPNTTIQPPNQNRLTNRIRRQAYRLGEHFSGDKHGILAFSGVYKSSGVGFDEKLKEASLSKLVEGYFQCHQYFDHVMALGHPNLALVTETAWFAGMKSLAQTEKPIMLHIRLGDYIKNQETIGVLSKDYYSKSLDLVRQHFPRSPLWVFSDDPEQASTYLGSTLGEPFRIIEQPTESTAAEAMMLMSLGSSIITSNSTFSWWAAKIGNSRVTVTPSQWFISGESPIGIHSDSWFTVESTWR